MPGANDTQELQEEQVVTCVIGTDDDGMTTGVWEEPELYPCKRISKHGKSYSEAVWKLYFTLLSDPLSRDG